MQTNFWESKVALVKFYAKKFTKGKSYYCINMKREKRYNMKGVPPFEHITIYPKIVDPLL